MPGCSEGGMLILMLKAWKMYGLPQSKAVDDSDIDANAMEMLSKSMVVRARVVSRESEVVSERANCARLEGVGVTDEFPSCASLEKA